MPCYSPLKGWKDNETGGITFDRAGDAKGHSLRSKEMEVACGQCLGCRLDRSRMWSARIVHEASLYEHSRGNCFVTLTYDDAELPEDWSLVKKDFQDFMKRLRKREDRKHGDPIRYFHCGEYGDICRHRTSTSVCPRCNTGRPHYHAIIFNHDFLDREVIGQKGDHTHYTSGVLTDVWKKGHTQVGSVTADSAGYVARYNLKKVTGLNAKDWYTYVDDDQEVHELTPEYATMSRRPGIGRDWFSKFATDVYPSNETPLTGKAPIKGVPRYYDKLLEQSEPELLEAVKAERQRFRAEHAADYTSERLYAAYRVKKAHNDIYLQREQNL